jgi:hypothetical protein
MIYQDEGPKSLELPGLWPGLFAFGLVLVQGALLAIGLGFGLGSLQGPGGEEFLATGSRLGLLFVPLFWLVQSRGLARPRWLVRLGALALLLALGLPWLVSQPGPAPLPVATPETGLPTLSRLAAACLWFSLAAAIEVRFWARPWPRGTRGWRGLTRTLSRSLAALAAVLVLSGYGQSTAGCAVAGALLALGVLAAVLGAVLALRLPKGFELQTCPRCGVQNHVPPQRPQGCHDCGLVLRWGQAPQFPLGAAESR